MCIRDSTRIDPEEGKKWEEAKDENKEING
jgi:hypothetical protein